MNEPTNQVTNINSTGAGEKNEEIGYAVKISGYIVWINGLPGVKINEIVVNESKARAIITAIDDDLVEALMLDDVKVKPQEAFRRTFEQMALSIGTYVLGRTINPLGMPIDGQSGFGKLGQSSAINLPPPKLNMREPLDRQFTTGISVVDTLVPIGCGQRELIVGDTHSGKTSFLLDTVINQKGKNIICIYALIGKPVSTIKNISEILKSNNADQYTAIVATSSSTIAPLIYLTPFVAMAMAEFFQKRGSDVLLVLDDLGIHAKYTREIALLSGKPPGKDSYPGDIFYTHARLLERAGNFNKLSGAKGSITALPVIESSLDDFSSYMTTNLMAMTDGHILFNGARYHQGIRPAVDIFLSVSRVGRQTQSLPQKSLSDKIKALLATAERYKSLSSLGSEISSQTLFTLKQGKMVEEILKQPILSNVDVTVQMIMLSLVFTPFFSEKPVEFVTVNRKTIITYLSSPKFNLEAFKASLVKLADAKNLIDRVALLTPELEKICQQIAQPQSQAQVAAN